MDYTQEMFLLSESGYAMPFQEDEKPVEVLLSYGQQKHPKTQQDFFHKGWDIKAPDYVLQALATGVVIGITTDEERGMSLFIRYGRYDVTYSHLKHCLVKFGDHVVARQNVGTTKRFFHLGIKMGAEDVDPQDFLQMIYSNMLTFEQAESGNTRIPVGNYDIHTDYDDSKEEMEQLMIRFMPEFLGAVSRGSYKVADNDVAALRGIFTNAYHDRCFYQTMPSLSNPLGFGDRAIPYIAQFQNMIMRFMLDFVAMTHNIFLSTMSEEDKKKLMTGVY